MATLRRQMKNMVNNYSEAEVKVREATSNDPWGPSSTLMSEISDLTYNIVALGEVMRMIWKRLNDNGKNWRHVYKSLVLLDYLVKNGNEKVAQQCKEHIVAIQTLKNFQFIEEQKDQGASVREKAKQLINLLRDDERLKAERNKAFRARERYAQNAMAISSDNKMIYGTAIPNANNATKRYDVSTTSLANAPPPSADLNLTPEIEAVRPSDSTEEDLQIKIALMLSKQDHEEELNRKRADEVKLQIALEQSKFEAQPNKLVDLGDFSPSKSKPSDPWTNPATNENGKNSPEKTNQEDIDNDEFFSKLKPPPKKNESLISPEKKSPIDPWSSPTLKSTSNGNNGVKTDAKAQLTSELDDLWGNKNTITASKTQPNLNLDDPWSSTTTNNQNRLAPAIVPSANNPWSSSNTTNLTNNTLVNDDPWSTKAPPVKPTSQQTNNSIWPSLIESSNQQQQANAASLLTGNIINNLWTTTTSTNTNTNVASAFSAPIVRPANQIVNNPFLGNSVFPSTNLNANSTLPNYSALSQPWLISSSITPSNTVTSSNKTTNPFLD